MKRYNLELWNHDEDRIEMRIVEQEYGHWVTWAAADQEIRDLEERIVSLEKEVAMLDSLYGGEK